MLQELGMGCCYPTSCSVGARVWYVAGISYLWTKSSVNVFARTDFHSPKHFVCDCHTKKYHIQWFLAFWTTTPGGASIGKPTQPSPSVSVFIADASRMGCQVMADALRRSCHQFAVVGLAVDAVGVRTELSEKQSDIALISAHLKDGHIAGFNVTREVRASYPRTEVVMLLDSIERAMVIEAFRAGTAGIVSRDEPFELLCKCIHAVHQGQVWAGSRELRFLLDAFAKPAPINDRSWRAPKLTKREEGLVHLVAEGLTNRDISRQLSLSENTVRNYLFRIFNKLGTSSRLELALYVVNQRECDQVGGG